MPLTLTSFERGYIDSALFASTDEHGENLLPLDFIDDLTFDAASVLADGAVTALCADCADFLSYLESLPGGLADVIAANEYRAGVDFFLSRNGHGAGYFDGDWGEHGNALQRAARTFGERNLLIGDDGFIHCYP